MKKLLFFAVFTVFAMSTSFAQDEDGGGDATSQGTWLVEINTGFGEVSGSGTAFMLRSIDGNTAYALGAEAGYFVIDDLALKAGLGYGDSGADGVDGTFNWKFGGKYYIAGQFPIGVDINGASGNSFSPMFLGFQAAYAWFVADNVSIEPGLRYGMGMNDDADLMTGDNGIFGVNIGFNIYFN